jgi:carbamoyltransferase
MPPVPYDGGISIGNAQLVYHCLLGNAAEHQPGQPSSYTMGRRYSRLEVMSACRSAQVRCSTATVHEILRRLARGEIIGLFSGSAESGRRALGNRSIIADPRADASTRVDST